LCGCRQPTHWHHSAKSTLVPAYSPKNSICGQNMWKFMKKMVEIFISSKGKGKFTKFQGGESKAKIVL
jgi:hypothetical protein